MLLCVMICFCNFNNLDSMEIIVFKLSFQIGAF